MHVERSVSSQKNTRIKHGYERATVAPSTFHSYSDKSTTHLRMAATKLIPAADDYCSVSVSSSSYFSLPPRGPLGYLKAYQAHKALMKQNQLITRYAAPSMREIAKAIPRELFGVWQRISMKEFPNIPKDVSFFVRSAVGLITYFKCIQLVGSHQTMLPSKAADSVWHAWLAWNRASLDDFCLKYFGRKIPHVPVDEFKTNVEDALVRTWVANCILNGIKCSAGRVPNLFSLDSSLRMPLGWRYARLSSPEDGVYHCALNLQGRSWNGTWYIHRDLSEANLHRLGYIKEIRASGRVFDDDDGKRSSPSDKNYTTDSGDVSAFALGGALTYYAWNDGCEGTPNGMPEDFSWIHFGGDGGGDSGVGCSGGESGGGCGGGGCGGGGCG